MSTDRHPVSIRREAGRSLMAGDLHGVIWTWLRGIPEKMGVLSLSATEIRFTYTPEYIDSGQPGFALRCSEWSPLPV